MLTTSAPNSTSNGIAASSMPSRASCGTSRGSRSGLTATQANRYPTARKARFHPTCAQWNRAARSNRSVKYSRNGAPANSVAATAGWVAQRSPAESRRFRRARRARCAPVRGRTDPASVSGAPSTSRIGTSIPTSMCAARCTLNIAAAYRPTPEQVASSSTAQPPNQAAVRDAGHDRRSRPSRRSPTRYPATSSAVNAR
ncbi:hypothetical protein GCM10009635_46160 [Actinocatenispora thailandica]